MRSVTDRLEKDVIVSGTPDHEDGDSAIAIFCRNAETIKKFWHGKVAGINQRMNIINIHFSKNVIMVNKKEEAESSR